MIPRIHIGFVTLTRNVDMEILAMMTYLASTRNYAFTVEFSQGCYICQNRNNIARSFMVNKDTDWLFFWDVDVVVRDREFFDKLIETSEKFDAKVVAGVYRLKGLDHLYPVTGDDGKNIKLGELKEPRLVQSAATGLMMIHREVIEKIPPPWFQVTNLPEGGVWPEDFNFCRLAREAGFKVAVDPRFETFHVKEVLKKHSMDITMEDFNKYHVG